MCNLKLDLIYNEEKYTRNIQKRENVYKRENGEITKLV